MGQETAVGYIRVSTEAQAEHGVSLEIQTSKIHKYCELHDLMLLEIIADEGISGRYMICRPGIQVLQKLVRKKKVRHVIVYSLSRLARNTRECLDLSEQMDKRNISLHSITEKLDTKSTMGKFFFRLMASLGEMESDLISERTLAAMNTKKEKKERASRYPPYGFQFIGNRIVPVDAEQNVIRTVLLLSESNYSLRKISKRLATQGLLNRSGQPFSPSTLSSIIKSTLNQTKES